VAASEALAAAGRGRGGVTRRPPWRERCDLACDVKIVDFIGARFQVQDFFLTIKHATKSGPFPSGE